MMLLSQLLGLPIEDTGGQRFANLRDMVGRWQLDRGLVVVGLVAGVGRRRFFVPWQQVAEMNGEGFRLSSFQVNFRQFERRTGEVLLEDDVMDQRLVDVRHRKVVRVNDIILVPLEGRLLVEGVDTGFPAILRRLLPGGLGRGFSAISLLNWTDVEWLPSEAYPAGKRSFPMLSRLHPVDVAHIVSELPHRQGADIVESLENDDAAEVLSEVSEEHQAALLKNMDEERAADILQEMEPDDAADLLGNLDPEKAGDLLRRMESEDAEDVKALMEYEEGTAGALMTNRFVAVPRDWSVARSIELLRNMEDRPEMIGHLLVVDSEETQRLSGMVPLIDLVLASPGDVMSELVTEEAPVVAADTSTSEVARRMSEYNLDIVPVVSEEGEVLGVVAADDVVEEMLPERWRRRLPRIFG